MAYQLSKAEKDLMIKVKENNKHVCYYCGKNITDPEDLTVDHKIPIARGGQTVEFNLVISCKNCNLTKSNLNESEYKSILNEAIEQMKSTNLYDIILFNNSLESAMEFKKLQISKKSEFQKAIEQEKNNLIDGVGALGQQPTLMVANILAPIIINMLSDVEKVLPVGKTFICSGIVDHEKDAVIQALNAHHFTVTEVKEKNGWVAIVAIYNGCK